MRFLVFLLLAGGLAQSAAAQAPADTTATHLQLPGADCAIFPAGATIPGSDIDDNEYKPGMKRFTPTAAQVTMAEDGLPDVQLDHVSARPEPTDNYDDYPILIRKHLKQYQRQYYGFYNKQKHACLYINLFIEKHDEAATDPTYWLSHAVRVMDGGWEYWSIYYDLNTHKFFHYEHSQE